MKMLLISINYRDSQIPNPISTNSWIFSTKTQKNLISYPARSVQKFRECRNEEGCRSKTFKYKIKRRTLMRGNMSLWHQISDAITTWHFQLTPKQFRRCKIFLSWLYRCQTIMRAKRNINNEKIDVNQIKFFFLCSLKSTYLHLALPTVCC